MCCILLITEKLLGTHDIFIGALENFLQDFEVTKSLKKAYGVIVLSSPWSEIFQKKSMGRVFAAPNFFSTSRTLLIQSALCFPDPVEALKYS